MNTPLLARALGLFVATGSLVVLVACSSATPGETCANNGQQCACSDSCNRSCETSSGTGCQFTCAAGKTCSFDCKSGNCSVTCGAGATCNVTCAGGGCSITAEADSSLDATCGNKGSCTVACTGSKKCTVDGKPADSAAPGLPGTDIPGLPDAGE